MDKPHILIGGQRGAGKSTLLARLLQEYHHPIYGFLTRMTEPDAEGFHQIYIHPADGSSLIQSEENRVGSCDSRIHNAKTAVFNGLGTQYLTHKGDGILVMDELGFLEAQAKDFCAAVMDCLDGDTPVLAVVKARFDVPFLNAVRSHPKAAFYELTPENREELYEALLPIIRSWDAKTNP